MEFQYEHQGTVHTIGLTQLDDGRFRAIIGERKIDFTATQQVDGAWQLTLNQQRILAYVASESDTRFVHINGDSVTLTAVDEHTRRRKSTSTAGDLTAQMPGQVVEVLIAEGDVVNSGQTLVILEAMKMEIRVTAPTEGIVKGVFVMQGDVVGRGQRLVEVSSK